jgi:hypothetical protein
VKPKIVKDGDLWRITLGLKNGLTWVFWGKSWRQVMHLGRLFHAGKALQAIDQAVTWQVDV